MTMLPPGIIELPPATREERIEWASACTQFIEAARRMRPYVEEKTGGRHGRAVADFDEALARIDKLTNVTRVTPQPPCDE